MAAVCKAWHEASKAPSLWRTHIFYLCSALASPRGLSWLRSRVKHIRHATILCLGSYDNSHDKLMRALQRANLRDLDINGTSNWCALGVVTARRVAARFARLLRSQKQLVGFQMRQAMWDLVTGINLLNVLATSSGKTILRLELEDFFDDTAINPVQFISCLAQFPNLCDLTINYEHLTDSLLYWLSQSRQNKAIQLGIVSWASSSHRLPRMSCQAWASLASSSPYVRVYLILQNIRNISDISKNVLLKEIPMFKLDLVGMPALDSDNVRQMIDLLRHVGISYGNNLSSLKLWSEIDLSEDIEDALINLLRHTPHLLSLDLHMDVHANLLGRLCTLQMKQVIKLQSLKMARSLTDSAEFNNFRHEVKTWFPVLKTLDLDFHIRAESAPNYSARREFEFIIADSAGVVDSRDKGNTDNSNNNNNNSNTNICYTVDSLCPTDDFHCTCINSRTKATRVHIQRTSIDAVIKYLALSAPSFFQRPSKTMSVNVKFT